MTLHPSFPPPDPSLSSPSSSSSSSPSSSSSAAASVSPATAPPLSCASQNVAPLSNTFPSIASLQQRLQQLQRLQQPLESSSSSSSPSSSSSSSSSFSSSYSSSSSSRQDSDLDSSSSTSSMTASSAAGVSVSVSSPSVGATSLDSIAASLMKDDNSSSTHHDPPVSNYTSLWSSLRRPLSLLPSLFSVQDEQSEVYNTEPCVNLLTPTRDSYVFVHDEDSTIAVPLPDSQTVTRSSSCSSPPLGGSLCLSAGDSMDVVHEGRVTDSVDSISDLLVAMGKGSATESVRPRYVMLEGNGRIAALKQAFPISDEISVGASTSSRLLVEVRCFEFPESQSDRNYQRAVWAVELARRVKGMQAGVGPRAI
eukprot:g27699.t1